MFHRKLKKEIAGLILSGKSRQEVYLELKSRLNEFNISNERLTRFIRFRPTLHARIKYRSAHNILIGFVLLLAFASVVLGFTLYLNNDIPAVLIFIFPIFEILILIELLYFRGQAYSGLALILSIQTLRNLDQMDFSPEGAWITVSVLVVIAIIISLSLYLSVKMCSAMQEVTVEIDSNGTKMKAIQMQFLDPIPETPEDIL